MAINKQQISVPLLKGVNTVVDPQQEQIGSLTVLRNAKFTKIGSISKRTGFQTIASYGTLNESDNVGSQVGGFWDPTQGQPRNVPISQGLAVRGVGGNPVVVSKDTIFQYSKSLKTLFRTGNYSPLNFGSYPVAEGDTPGEFNSQSVVYGSWVYMISHGTGTGQSRLSVFDISGREPLVVVESTPLYLTMSGSAFPNSVDGGSTFNAFNIPNPVDYTESAKLLIHNSKLYIFIASELPSLSASKQSQLFYKCCDPFDTTALTSFLQSGNLIGNDQSPEDGGWLPVYDGALFTGTDYAVDGYNVNSIYDVISHSEGIIIAMVTTSGSNETICRKYPDQPYYKFSEEHGWTDRAQALGLYRLKDLNPEIYDTATQLLTGTYSGDIRYRNYRNVPSSGDIALVQGASNKIIYTSINEHYTKAFEQVKTLDAGLTGLIRRVSLIVNDKLFFGDSQTGYRAYERTGGFYFTIQATWQRNLEAPLGSSNYNQIPYFYNDTVYNLDDTQIDTQASTTTSARIVVDENWNQVVIPYPGFSTTATQLPNWARVSTLFYQFYVSFSPGTGSTSGTVSAQGEILLYDYALGVSLAGKPFQVRWGSSAVEKYPNHQMPWSERAGVWIQPFATQSELQSSYVFKQVYGPYNTISPEQYGFTNYYYILHNSSWIGQLSYGLGGGMSIYPDETGGISRSFNSFSDTTYLQTGTDQSKKGVVYPYIQKYKLLDPPNFVTSTISLSRFTNTVGRLTNILFDEAIPNQSQEIAQSLVVPGLGVSQITGGAQNEAGWFQSPPRLYIFYENGTTVFPGSLGMPQVPSTGTDTVFFKDATYNWVVLYTSRDANGRIIRSSLSQQLSVNISNITGTNLGFSQMSLLVPLCQVSNRNRDNLTMELYRTTNNGTVFYKVNTSASFNGQPPSGKGVYIVPPTTPGSPGTIKAAFFRAVVDDTPDSELTDNELLYTTGNALENTPPPACSIMETYKNILFMAGLENPYNIQYSKVVSFDTALDFNDTLIIETPSSGGAVTALKGMDNNLFIFKESSIYYIAGGQNNFTSYLKTRDNQSSSIELAIVSNNIGCINRNSCVLTPIGILFKSNRGIYILGRNLQLEFIGAPVQAYDNWEITDASLYAKEGEVRFITKQDDCIVYNYERNIWYTFSQHMGSSNCVLEDRYYYLNQKGSLQLESKSYQDNGSPIPLQMETGWMSFSEPQGFQRIYRMLILGQYKSDHQLRIRVAYDYIDEWVEEKIIKITDSNTSMIGPDAVAAGEPGVPGDELDKFWTTHYGGPDETRLGAGGLQEVNETGGPWGFPGDEIHGKLVVEGQYGDPNVDFKYTPFPDDGDYKNIEMTGTTQRVDSPYPSPSDPDQFWVGASQPYSINEGLQYQFRINFKKQKCESIKILIETIQDTGQDEEAASFSNLSFIVGLKRGGYKIKQSRVKGTQ